MRQSSADNWLISERRTIGLIRHIDSSTIPSDVRNPGFGEKIHRRQKEGGGLAIVRELKYRVLEKDSRHTDAECTYSIVNEPDGRKALQIDTYGSEHRKFPGKVSQSIRFSPEGLKQLRKILSEHFDA
jgi:hypothetical protein